MLYIGLLIEKSSNKAYDQNLKKNHALISKTLNNNKLILCHSWWSKEFASFK